MSELASEGTVGIDVSDFGPIVKARVDLRPMTVFVGPSNTGKSYLAILVYALQRYFGGDDSYTFRRFPNVYTHYIDFQELAKQNNSDERINELLKLLWHSLADQKANGADSVILAPELAEALRLQFEKNAGPLAREIGRCFGIGESYKLTRKGRNNVARISIRRCMPNGTKFGVQTLTLGREAELEATIPAETPIPTNNGANSDAEIFLRQYVSLFDERQSESILRRFPASRMLSQLVDLLLPAVVGVLNLPAYYLPADRTGVMHAHSVVVSSLIASAPTAGLRPVARAAMLSGVLADFMEQLIDINRTGRVRHKRDPDLGKNIEKGILGGSVMVDRLALSGYPRFTYRPVGWKDELELANASSMVSELAPVVLYLRHLVGPGNVLIVEEPESHLHPAMQVELTRQLALLVNAGIRVIVTTHSEWLLEELANIVRRSELPPSKRSGMVGGTISLDPDQVGAWLFVPKSRPKGSVVQEIHLDGSGLYPSGFEKVAKLLHNDWADISSRIDEET